MNLFQFLLFLNTYMLKGETIEFLKTKYIYDGLTPSYKLDLHEITDENEFLITAMMISTGEELPGICYAKTTSITYTDPIYEIKYKQEAYPYIQYKLNNGYDVLKDERIKANVPRSFTLLSRISNDKLEIRNNNILIPESIMQNICGQFTKDEKWLYFLLMNIHIDDYSGPGLGIRKAFQIKKRWKYSLSLARWEEFKKFMRPEISDTEFNHRALYLLQAYADKGTSKYKIGKASDLMKRLRTPEYRNASIIMTSIVSNENESERELINAFKEAFKPIKEDRNGNYGNEWFEGDVKQMRLKFIEITNKWQ